MKKEKEDITKIFSSRLKDFEMDVPDVIWNQLSDKLAKEPTVSGKRKALPKKIVLTIVGIAASISLLLLIIHTKTDTTSVYTENNKEITKHYVKTASLNNASNVSKKPFSYQARIYRKKFLSSSNISNQNFPQINSNSTRSEDITENQENKKKEESVSESKNIREPEKSIIELERKTEEFSNAAKNETDKLFADNNIKVKKQRDKQKLGLMAGGGLGLASQSMTANQVLSLNSTSNSSTLRSESVSSTRSSKSTYQLDHALPISVSVGITKPLNDFMNFEIGLSYSYLYSKQKGSSSATTKQVQQFYYLGLPVGINCRIANWNQFRLGILVGGSIQKDIAGRIKEEVESSSYGENSSTKIHQKYIQPSMNANLHISYLISKNLSLYGKLGGAYYFDMNDNYSTIYSDKNFLPDLGVGLLYELNY